LRKLAPVFLLAGFALPAFAAGQATVVPPHRATSEHFGLVTVEQLEQGLTAIHSRRDKEVAQRLGGLNLTERLSTARLEQLKAGLPGEKSRLALLALADRSAFLDLPAQEILSNAAPDSATQSQIISRATSFVLSTVSRLPNFFATETATRFQDVKVSSGANPKISVPDQGYFVMDKRSTSVTYRDGREVLEATVDKKQKSNQSSTEGLTTHGVFGPILDVAMGNILHGKVTWGHWEQGPTGPLAVFRYEVPEDKSDYTVQYCCFQSGWGEMRTFRAIPGYHGEIAIDPASGAVLRLVLKTELQQALPMKRSDELVEYGPVEIGGRTYICPLKSVSITKVKALASDRSASGAGGNNKPGSSTDNELKQTETVSEPAVTAINDVIFENYHLFRGEVRILSGDSAETEEKAPASIPAAASETAPKR
jgi:hypothetical protein